MHPSTSTILLISEDRGLLRRLSTVLTTTGYRLQQTSQKEQAATLLAADPPEVLILDAGRSIRPALGLLQIADSGQLGRHPYTLVIVDNPTREDLIAAVEAGANDFLAAPVANGELLARVRAGTRFRQCERRLLDMGGTHAVTGLPGFAAFEHRLRRELSRPGRKHGTPSLVAVDLDFYWTIPRFHGEAAGEAVLRATAQALRDAAHGSASVYALGGDRFVVLLPGVAEEAAVSWTERARAAFAEFKFPADEKIPRITASCGVAGCASDEDSEGLIWNVLQALRSAKSSGRDCVARFGEFSEEPSEVDTTAPFKLLQDSVARDIFSPCGLALRADDWLADAAALFRRTRLPAFPVVDENGEAAGLLTAAAVRAGCTPGSAARVADAMSVDVTKFDEQTEFVTLLQYFAQYPEAVVIVVRDGKPTGMLTGDSLVAPVNSSERSPAAEGRLIPWEYATEADAV
jgi:two-component system, cell cycle response regulator